MGKNSTVTALQSLMDDLGINYGQAALAMGVSSGTVRFSLVTGELPVRPDARAKFVKFVDVNRGATCRQDLRFV